MTISTLAAVIITILASTTMARDVLIIGEELKEGESLDVGDYKLIMQQEHCNLVLYDKQAAIWMSNTAVQGKIGCNAKLSERGLLSIYDVNGDTVYNSGSELCCGNFVLVLQKNRNLVLYGFSIWATGTFKTMEDGEDVVSAMIYNGAILASTAGVERDVMLSGDELKEGESLDVGDYKLVMQERCNLALYDKEHPIWISNAGELGKTGCVAEFTHYGVLAIFDRYGGQRKRIFASNIDQKLGNYALVLQADRNLVIYGPVRWSTDTELKKVGGVGVADMNGTVDHDGGSSARTGLQKNTTAGLGDVHDQLEFAAASAAA